MSVIGFHASHEQVHPAALLDAVRHAEEVGFTAAMCSDHFAPWHPTQGQSGFAWSWLGAALATTTLPLGAVTAPGQRYHPAIVAQSIATLDAMFPGRFWVALGSGEAMNEHITGDRWSRKDVRDARLRECVEVIRALLAGEEGTHDGLVTVAPAPLWTPPQRAPQPPPPPVDPARTSAATARPRCHRRHRPRRRRLGRRPDHRQPAARHAPGGARRLPRRRCPRHRRAAAAPGLRPRRGTRAGPRPRAVAQRRRLATPCVGPGDPG